MRRRLRPATMIDGRFARTSTFVAIRAAQLRRTPVWVWAIALAPASGVALMSGSVGLGLAVAIGLDALLALGIAVREGGAWAKLSAADSNILKLDRIRRRVGLRAAIEEETLDAIESWAADWESIDNSLQSEAWQAQSRLAMRIDRAAARAMGELIYWARQPGAEARESADAAAARLGRLRAAVNGVSALMASYAREERESNEAPLPGDTPEVRNLDLAILEIEFGLLA